MIKARLRTFLIISAAAIGGAFLMACGDDEVEPDPTVSVTTTATTGATATATSAPSSPSPVATSTSSATPQPTGTGVAVVDAVIASVLANDAAAVKDGFAYFKVDCSTNPTGGFPFPPECLEGETDGTPIDVFLSLSGEGAYTRATDVDQALSSWLSGSLRLYAVIERPAPVAEAGNARYIVVFEAPDGAGPRLWLSDAGIVGLAYDPGKNLGAAAMLVPGGTYLIAPPTP